MKINQTSHAGNKKMKLTDHQVAVAGNYGLDPDKINAERNPQDALFCTLCEMGMPEFEVGELIYGR